MPSYHKILPLAMCLVMGTLGGWGQDNPMDDKQEAVAPGDPVTSDAYALAEGMQLEYQTSATFSIQGQIAESQEAQIRSLYTTLMQAGDMATIFASVNIASMAKNGKPQKNENTGARFSFELAGNGDIGDRSNGFERLSFPGWSSKADFYPIPVEERSTISLVTPMINMPVMVSAKRTVEGTDIKVEANYTPSAAGANPMAPPIKVFKASWVYSSADKSLKSSRSELQVEIPSRTATKSDLYLTIASERKKAAKLPSGELDTLRKDVAAGLAAFGKMRESASERESNTTKTLEVMAAYVKDNPKGEFATLFSEISKQITMMRQLEENAANIAKGMKAPLFGAKTLDGSAIKLADLKGKVVLLDFWATWCGPCVAEFPNMKAVYDKYKDKGFTIIGVNADREEEALTKFIKDKQVEWKQIFESQPEEGTVQFLYGVMKYPTTVLIDREGVIKAVDLRGDDLESAITELVTGEKPKAGTDKDKQIAPGKDKDATPQL
ncbi:MAG: TlpA disulfide reductase family protein [Candidatus Sumerlaeota bacterium]|nr:TlpA disulfide reductase family protein [Candidatus Sumerlaeota bacterium]